MEFKRRYTLKSGFSTAALSSVVFLVLFFFVLTSSTFSQEGIGVQLPNSENNEAIMLDPTTITVTAAGKYLVNDFEVNKDQIEANLLSLTEGSETPGFTIRADANAKHKDVLFLLEIAKKNHFNTAIATQ